MPRAIRIIQIFSFIEFNLSNCLFFIIPHLRNLKINEK